MNPVTNSLRLDFVRRAAEGITGVDHIVEFSNDATTWLPGGRLVEGIPSGFGMERVIGEDDAPAIGTNRSPTRFAPVRVTEK
jgi:hypothetical protein